MTSHAKQTSSIESITNKKKCLVAEINLILNKQNGQEKEIDLNMSNLEIKQLIRSI